MKRIPAYFASTALALYFIGFGAAFLFKPDLAGDFGLQWFNNAGLTEIRVYYGAFSIAAGAFISYLMMKNRVLDALTGGVFFSGFVVFSRLLFTTLDGAWGDDYTGLAIPAESAFFILLFIFRSIEASYQKKIPDNSFDQLMKKQSIELSEKRKLKTLFICSSNVCRSPWCEYQYNRMVQGDRELQELADEAGSSAVFNRSKEIHKMTRNALIADGFDTDFVDSHQPHFKADQPEDFESADIIIGMSKTHKLMVPAKYRKKYLPISQAAGYEYQGIEDPFLIRDPKKYKKVMDRLTHYTKEFAQQIKKAAL